ncbi:MAG: hypothetical protein ACJAVK_000031 [Akkermansiaceae bacterium]
MINEFILNKLGLWIALPSDQKMTKPLLTLSAIALFAGGMMSGRLLFPISQSPDPDTSSNSTRTITKKTSTSRDLSRQLNTIASLISNWAKKDPDLKEYAKGTIEATGSQSDPASAAEARVLSHAGDWILHDSEAAERWLKSRGPHKQISASNDTLIDLAREHPSQAAELYKQMLSWPSHPDLPGANLMNAAGQIAGRWARKDPQAVIAWLDSLEADHAKDNALSQATTNLAKYAPVQTAELFAKISSEEFRGAAARDIDKQNFYDQPQIAFEWSQKIEDHSLQLRKTGDVLSRIQSQVDFEGAREMVSQDNLTEAEKTKLLQRI